MRRYDAVLYDFDGTVVDSFPGIGRSVQYALKEGFDIEVEDYKTLGAFLGPPLHDSFQRYYDFDEEQTNRAVVKYRERYNTVGLYESELYPGARESFQRLKAAGVALAIASSKPTHLIETLLEHFGVADCFDAVVGTSHTEGGVADPMTKTDCVLAALAALGFLEDRERAAMVGDRWLDAQGAENSGVDFIAAAYSPYIEPDEFDDFACAFKASSLLDVAGYVLGEPKIGN